MSGALENIRHERFVRHFVRTSNASAAYRLAGFNPTTRNALDASASRLLRFAKVQSRIADLRRHIGRKTQLSAESLMSQCEQDRELARARGQVAAAIAATALQAKLAGLLVDRRETGKPGQFEASQSPEAVIVAIADEHGAEAGELARRLIELVSRPVSQATSPPSP